MRYDFGESGGRKSWGELWRAGRFGPDGPFGEQGPFGPDGPLSDRGSNERGGGGRGRRRRMFESGELRLVLLQLIADQPRHGYQ